jgi:hypothetical protein
MIAVESSSRVPTMALAQQDFSRAAAAPTTTPDRFCVKSVDDLRRENEELRDLVIQLTKIVVRNVMERR